VHQFATDDQVTGVTCLGWATNLTSRSTSSVSAGQNPGSWGAFLTDDGLSGDEKTPLDLPRDLSLIDIETSLPKLSVLAAAGSS